MSVFRLVLREIRHRKLNFLMALLSVSVAVGCLVGAMTLLEAHKLRTHEIMVVKLQEVDDAGKKLNDAMRKITKGLGFNIIILPAEQDLNEFYVQGVSSKTMQEDYVDKLANSNIMTVNHLLPMVSAKLTWPEKNDRPVFLIGTRGEVPISHRTGKKKKPLLDQVPAGTMVLGHQIHTDEKLKVGDKVAFRGKEFEITECYKERGTSDDSTIWINLAEAQEMLQLENLVNAIVALECNCATEDRVAEVRKEIASILPGTQVIERGPPALARAEARNQAAESAKASLAQAEEHRAQLRQQREKFAAVLVPLVIVGCAVWIGFLTFGNVRQRSSEIGILRAIGLRTAQILAIFLGKALVVGLLGAAIGYAAGFSVGVVWGDLPMSAETSSQLFVPGLLIAAVLLAPLLSGLASWIPAMLAAGQDPALVLQEE